MKQKQPRALTLGQRRAVHGDRVAFAHIDGRAREHAPIDRDAPFAIHCSASRREQRRRAPSPWRRVRLEGFFARVDGAACAGDFVARGLALEGAVLAASAFQNAAFQNAAFQNAAFLAAEILGAASCLARRQRALAQRFRWIVAAWAVRAFRGGRAVLVFHRSCALIAGKAPRMKGRSASRRL